MRTKNNKNKNKNKNKNNKNNKSKKNKTIKIVKPILHTINNYNVVFLKNKSKTITIQSYIFNGFIHEDKDDVGINHLLEHVLMNAYKKCKNFNCYKYFNEIGILKNASTDNNIIKYYTLGLLKNIDIMLDFIINITVNPVFNTKLINREKEAVHNEALIHLDNPITALYNIISHHFYTIKGLKYRYDYQQHIKNLKKFDYKYLMNYYKKNYNNSNTYFVISGDINTGHIIKLLKNMLPLNPIEKSINYNKLNCYTNKKDSFFIQNKTMESTKILFYFPTYFHINVNKLIILKLAVNILQSLLLEQLRVEKELIYSIIFNIETNICGSIANISVNTKNDHYVKVINECKNIINKYKKENIEKKYLEAAKNKYLIKFFNKKFNTNDYAEFYGIQYIYKENLNTKILSPDQYKNQILKVTLKDVKSIIKEVFNFDKCMIAHSNKGTPSP
jgi:predicted Zn-dependent peptidase